MPYNWGTVPGHGNFREKPSEKLEQTLNLYSNEDATKLSFTARPLSISYEEDDDKVYMCFESSEEPVLLPPLK